jgi:hypothetical protein
MLQKAPLNLCTGNTLEISQPGISAAITADVKNWQTFKNAPRQSRAAIENIAIVLAWNRSGVGSRQKWQPQLPRICVRDKFALSP